MSPEHQEFLSAFTANDEPAQPTIPVQPKSEYEQAFSDFTKPDAPPNELATVGGEASPTDLESTDQVAGAAVAAVSSKAKSGPKGKKMPSMSSGAYPQIKPDRSADEYISSFNSMARADEADRAAAARSSAQEAAKLAGK